MGVFLGLAVLFLTVPPLLSAPATPAPTCTSVRAPQPVPTPTRPAWAGEEPRVSLEPVPDAVLDPLVPEYLDRTIARFAACWNAGDWSTVVRGTTPRFLITAFGVSPDPASLEKPGLGPVTLLEASTPRLWSAGTQCPTNAPPFRAVLAPWNEEPVSREVTIEDRRRVHQVISRAHRLELEGIYESRRLNRV